MDSHRDRRRSRPAHRAAVVLCAAALVAAQCNPGGGGGGGGPGAGGADSGTFDAAGGGGATGVAGSGATAGIAGTGGAAGIAGTGGTAGADTGDANVGGAGGSAGTGTDAGTGPGGTAGASGTGGTGGAPPVSQYCGDGVRDPVTEECDDGNGTTGDSCFACQVQDLVAGPPMAMSEAGAVTGGRRLGTGRHPVAGGADGFAVAKVRDEQGSASLTLSTFDPNGVPLQKAIDVAAGTTPILDANPVVAALGGGKYAVAWTDFGGDGDELGIAMRTVDAATGALGPLGYANSATAFSQYDPDILRVGSTVVVSWMDDTDPINGPDLELRTFDTSLAPQGNQTVLANSAAAEGDVAFAPFEGSWAVAWRSASGGQEMLYAEAAGVQWTVGPILGGPADDKPALAELDANDLLLVFTEGTDPLDTGIANVPRLRGAILNTGMPGDTGKFDIDPQASPYAGDATIGQSQPNAVRAGNHVYISWRSAALTGDANGEEVWLSRVDWDVPTATADIQPEIPLPRWPSHEPGDQRQPGLAPSLLPQGTGTALATAWEDYGDNFGAKEGNPDVVVELIPTPIVRLSIGQDGGIGQ